MFENFVEGFNSDSKALRKLLQGAQSEKDALLCRENLRNLNQTVNLRLRNGDIPL